MLQRDAPGNTASLRFTRDASLTDSVLTLQKSSDGHEWTPLAVSTSGGPTVPAAIAEVSESGSGTVIVTVTEQRSPGRQMYRLKMTNSQ